MQEDNAPGNAAEDLHQPANVAVTPGRERPTGQALKAEDLFDSASSRHAMAAGALGELQASPLGG